MTRDTLTDIVCRTSKPKENDYRLPDRDGLYLLITTKGGKLWRYNYSFENKKYILSLGKYPAISLSKARELHADAMKLKSNGINPAKAKSEAKAQKKQANEQIIIKELEAQKKNESHLENVINGWLSHIEGQVTPRYYLKISALLQNNIIPFIGKKAIDEITPLELLEVAKKKEAQGKLDTAHRLLQVCGQVWKYAITHGKCSYNIVMSIDKKYALKRHERKNYPHITDENVFATFLKDTSSYWGNPSVRYLLKIYPYLFVRPSELRLAEWSEFNLEKKEWTVPADRIGRKTGKIHIVPLPDKVIELLKELQAINGGFTHLFVGEPASQAVSEGAVRMALKRMGYDGIMSAHGFRHTASTILNERKQEHGFDGDVIERCLSHLDKNKIRGTYNKAEYYPQRVALMQWWADFLDRLKNG